MQTLMCHGLLKDYSYQIPEEYTLQEGQLRLAIKRIKAEVKQELEDNHTLSYSDALAKAVDYIADLVDVSMDD